MGSLGTTTNNIVSQNIIIGSNSFAYVDAPITLFKASNNTFRGNLIGVGADGKTPLGHCPRGISFDNSFKSYASINNTFGGPNPGDGNIIVFEAANQSGANSPTPAGIAAIGDSGRNFINGNSISGTEGLGTTLQRRVLRLTTRATQTAFRTTRC